MRLSCPNCLTEYDVPDAALAGRSRNLRCAHCGHQWHFTAPVAEAEAEPVIPVEPGFSWAPPPAAPAGWPDFAPEKSSIARPLEVVRTFGQPEDDLARDEVKAAATREVFVAPAPSFAERFVEPAEPPLAEARLQEPPFQESAFEAAPLDDTLTEEAPVIELPALSDADFRTPPPAEADSFAALVSAARRKSLEYEPEPPPPPPRLPTSNKKMIIILVIVLVLGLIVLERRYVIDMIPASAKLFHAFGLN